MKILVVCQYYYPEPFRISDICEALVKKGHEVTVVTGTPNYPMGEVYPGYEKGQKTDEILNGVKVHRCVTAPRKTGGFNRLKNYFSYPIKSKQYIRNLADEYDVVFINQLSPVMMAEAGIVYGKKYHKKIVLYCLDLWPESLVAGGISRSSLIFKFFHILSKKIYKEVDSILVTSYSFTKYFEEKFGINRNVHYFPQYAEDIFSPEECSKKDDEYIDLMFAGNVGTAQSVGTIIETARRCQDIETLRWHIVGDGIELSELKKKSKDLPITFYGRKKLEEMPRYYSLADAMIVTMQKDPILSLTLPGKVQSYMAAGKPILGAIDGETQKIVREAECGFVADAENSMMFEEVVRLFVSTENKKRFGQNARIFYLNHFSKENFVTKLENELKGLDYEE